MVSDTEPEPPPGRSPSPATFLVRALTPQSATKPRPAFSTPKTVMTKPTTRSASRPTAGELRRRLDNASSDAEDETALRAQVELWSRLRRVFASNNFSSGLEALDKLALAAISDDTTAPLSLTSSAILLPSPDLMSAQEPSAHALFAPPSDSARSKRAHQSGSGKSKAPPAKKRRTVSKSRRPWFQLPSNAPKRIKEDLARLTEEAADQGTTPERLAYPWHDQRGWYDPAEHPELHLMHWRFFMQHRATFLILAVYAPTDDASARRKQKTLACQKRLQFISYNIEEFGYYGFLERFENGAHDHLMWLGGKPAKHSTTAKKAKTQDDSTDPPQDDLAQLLRRDPRHYERVIERVLDPARVDEEGFTSIPDLLLQSNALDPTRPAHLRLSTNALARIVLDVTTKDPSNPSWVGNRSSGPWKKLLSDTSLRSVQLKLAKRLRKGKSVVTYDQKPFKASEQRDDHSDFEDDGAPMIQPPTPPIDTSPPKTTKTQASTGLSDSSEDEDDDNRSQDHDSGDDEANSDASDDKDKDAAAQFSSDESDDELEDSLNLKKPRDKSQDTNDTTDEAASDTTGSNAERTAGTDSK